MKKYELLIRKLSKGKISRYEFDYMIADINNDSLFEQDESLEFLQLFGLPIVEENNEIYLKTLSTPYKDQVFCFVDIETNGNSPITNQIIEIGAIKYQNGKVIDRFGSLIYSDFVPNYITRITNIRTEDLRNAASLKKVLYDFKLFLGDSIFVAHNVNFDFNFISNSLNRLGYGKLLNRKLCTIDLAKKTIEAEKYGLAYLIEHLNIDTPTHHRAQADAFSSLKVFEEAIKNLPQDIYSTEDLLYFAKPDDVKKKRKKNSSVH